MDKAERRINLRPVHPYKRSMNHNKEQEILSRRESGTVADEAA